MTATAAALEFPPLLTGIAVPGDPYEAALQSVREEVEPGAVFYGSDPHVLETAFVLAPETSLEDAMPVVFAVTLGLNDAIGALAPPKVALHLVWPDRVRVNGALCGKVRAAASTDDPKAEPDWLVLGLEVPIQSAPGAEPGLNPNETNLYEEGCGDLTGPDLVEAWARHTMNWLHIFLTEGFQPLHAEWRVKAHGYGEDIDYPEPGKFLGLDERGGLILKDGAGTTRILPLTRLLSSRKRP
ncbi:MAG: biotin/lipoate--protein ligase family protein [Paracoccaceae bacterium]|nr:biotin/lipoate--protein ligase family protein [Paracoccaceae bacterium]